MAVTWYDIVGGSHNASLVAANYDPDVSSVVTAGGTATVKTSGGTFGAIKHVELVGTGSGELSVRVTISSSDDVSAAVEFSLTSNFSAETVNMWFGTGTTRCMAVASLATRAIRVKDSANANKWTTSPSATSSPTTYSLTTRYVLSVKVHRAASAGTYQVILYDYDTGSVVIDSGVQTSQATGAAGIDTIRLGLKAASSSETNTMEISGVAVDPSASAIITPRSAADPPTIDIDQPAGNLVDLRASIIGDDSTELSYADPVHVSGPTLTWSELVPGIWLFVQDDGDTDSVYTFEVEQDDLQTASGDATIPTLPFAALNVAAPLRPLNTPPDNVWG